MIVKKKIEHEIKAVEPVKVVIEIIDNNYYAWEYNNNEFIMQSSTKDCMLEELKKKFPNRNINLLSKEKIEWLQKK